MAYPLVMRLVIAMTLMPDASYGEALSRLAGLLADVPFALEWHVPTGKVITEWRLLGRGAGLGGGFWHPARPPPPGGPAAGAPAAPAPPAAGGLGLPMAPGGGWLPDGSRLSWLNAPSGKEADRLPVRVTEHNAVMPGPGGTGQASETCTIITTLLDYRAAPAGAVRETYL